MLPSIEIQYRKISRETLNDFERQMDKSINLRIYEDPLDHFDPPADLVIYVNEHLTEIIVGGISGILTSAVWDGIKSLWHKIATKSTKEDPREIELNFKISKDKTIEFNLSGNVNPEQIDPIVAEMLKYLRDVEQNRRDFKNIDFFDTQSAKPRIRVRFNSSTKKLEVVNITMEMKKREEMIRKLMGRLDS